MCPSQGRYLHTEQHNREYIHTDIHASSGIRTHDPSVWAGKDGSWLTPRGHCERQQYQITKENTGSAGQEKACALEFVSAVNFFVLKLET
jgi:hypothetical protein